MSIEQKQQYYKEWKVFDNIPEGWVIDKTAGSPMPKSVFIHNGKSVLNGQERAILRQGTTAKTARRRKVVTLAVNTKPTPPEESESKPVSFKVKVKKVKPPGRTASTAEAVIDSSDAKPDNKVVKPTVSFLVKELQRIHKFSWGAVGNAIGNLLKKIGELEEDNLNGGKDGTKK